MPLSAGVWPSLAVVFGEYAAFLLGASTIYVGGNWLAKSTAVKASKGKG